MRAFKRFDIEIPGLSEKERLVLDKLVEASEMVAPLYEKQKNPKKKGANFYSEEFTKEEIEEAAENNPDILHPYTFVEKARLRKMKTVPFSSRFKNELKRASKKIEEAAKITDDGEFKRYLKEMAQALLKNEYARNEVLWITQKDSKFNFIIGPVERYLDRLFFKKCAYQAWVGVVDEKRTEEAQRFKDIIMGSRRKILPDTAKIKLPELKIDINKTVCFSGCIADHMFTGTNLPNSMDLMQEHGSRLTIFESSLDVKFENDHYSLFQKIFTPELQEEYSREELYEGSLRCILLHEISHSLIRYEDAEERLKELFPVFDEVLAYILGIKACTSLILKGVIDQKEVEAILLMHLVRNLTWWEDFKNNPGVRDYTIGGAIATSFFLEEGAIKMKNGFCVPDLNKLFLSIGRLSRVLEYHLATGSYEEAQRFVDRYGSLDVFERCDRDLKNL